MADRMQHCSQCLYFMTLVMMYPYSDGDTSDFDFLDVCFCIRIQNEKSASIRFPYFKIHRHCKSFNVFSTCLSLKCA